MPRRATPCWVAMSKIRIATCSTSRFRCRSRPRARSVSPRPWCGSSGSECRCRRVRRTVMRARSRCLWDAPASVNVSTTQDEERPGIATREEFVAAMWPAAQASARELGVDPRVLIAQAALETGWGRAVMQHGDGRSSHNLFGIKADNNWSGASVNVATLEYRDGLAAKERANFRSYDSYEQSFADYVDFIKSQPRYREALAHGGDARRYLSELQSAGYATDPRYADKIGSILQGEVLSGRSSDLTGSGGGPIA